MLDDLKYTINDRNPTCHNCQPQSFHQLWQIALARQHTRQHEPFSRLSQGLSDLSALDYRRKHLPSFAIPPRSAFEPTMYPVASQQVSQILSRIWTVTYRSRSRERVEESFSESKAGWNESLSEQMGKTVFRCWPQCQQDIHEYEQIPGKVWWITGMSTWGRETLAVMIVVPYSFLNSLNLLPSTIRAITSRISNACRVSVPTMPCSSNAGYKGSSGVALG